MKKGFTLIELLSVIVVLAIIALITVPVISGVISKARLNALKDSAYGLIDASNLYYAVNGVSNTVRFDKNDSEDTLKNLKYKGEVKEGSIVINQKGKITVCITDGKNSAYKNYNENEVTLVQKKTCTVPSNTNIVYLDNEATLTELSNQELTDRLLALEEENQTLKSKVLTLESNSTTKDEIYPVGSIYLSVDNTNPSTLFGGTWEKIEGKFLLSSDNTFTLGSTGGSTSTQYTPTGTVGNTTLTVDQIPAHSHSVSLSKPSGYDYDMYGMAGTWSSKPVKAPASSYIFDIAGGIWNQSFQSGVLFLKGGTLKIANTGGSQAHTHTFTGTASNINTMPPYLVVNVWKRVN